MHPQNFMIFGTYKVYNTEMRMCKIHQYYVKIWTRVWSLIFGPSWKYTYVLF